MSSTQNSPQVSADTARSHSPSSSSRSGMIFGDMKETAKGFLHKAVKNIFPLGSAAVFHIYSGLKKSINSSMHCTLCYPTRHWDILTITCFRKFIILLLCFQVMTGHLSGVCSPVETSATGFPLCWVETRGLHPHPLDTASIHNKEKPGCSETAAPQ